MKYQGKTNLAFMVCRQLSGATIKISNSEEGSKDRTVTISGTPEAINLAQYLINTRWVGDPGTQMPAGSFTSHEHVHSVRNLHEETGTKGMAYGLYGFPEHPLSAPVIS